MRTTVIGARGFIGGHVRKKIEEMGRDVFAPNRDDDSIFREHLGHVIYCAGVTSDFRYRPYDTVRAHVSLVADLLEKADFESFLYLSSTRVYANRLADSVVTEEDMIAVNPHHMEDLFGLSKLLGESLCLTCDRSNVRVARVSNVCGNDFESNNFIYSIIKDAVDKGEIVLRTTMDSEKDYIHVDDVVRLIMKISEKGNQRIYNVASGINITNQALVDKIIRISGCTATAESDAFTMKFPTLSIDRVKQEFSYEPINCLDRVEELVAYYKEGKKGRL